jgi:hypothetical protein
MAVERRTLWLGGVLVVGVVAAIVVRSTDGTPPARAGAQRRGSVARGAGTDSTVAADIKLDALKAERSEPVSQGRNPFRFTPKAAPPPPPKPGASATGPAAALPTGPVVPSGPPPPPPITLKYIGLVEKADGTKIAVLSDGRRPIHGVEGQEIEGQYRILKIGLESIEISYLDGRGRQTIRLTGK